MAVEPDTGLDRLLTDKKRELEAEMRQYEQLVDDLVDDLDGTEPVDERFWTAAIGDEEALELLIERLSAADDRIVIVAASPSQQFDIDEVGSRVLSELVEALDRGVRVSLLLRPELVEVMPENVGRRYRRQLRQYDTFSIRINADVTGTFEIIDDAEVCIEVPHPLHAEQTFALINLKDREFVANVEAEFEPRWNEAESLRM